MLTNKQQQNDIKTIRQMQTFANLTVNTHKQIVIELESTEFFINLSQILLNFFFFV